jgi:mRNA interferase MazF
VGTALATEEAATASSVAPMRQYEVRWATLPLPIGRRPVLLLSRTPAYEYLEKVIVAEITTTVRGIPQEVEIGRAEGLARPSVANLDNVHVISIDAIGARVGMLAPRRVTVLKRALGYALDWPELKVLDA